MATIAQKRLHASVERFVAARPEFSDDLRDRMIVALSDAPLRRPAPADDEQLASAS